MSQLTLREVQVIDLVITGAPNRAVSTELGISVETVKRHLSNIYDKVGCSNRTELAAMYPTFCAIVNQRIDELIADLQNRKR